MSGTTLAENSMRLVAPWGFYGMGNTGDEGTLCGFARLLAVSDIAAVVSVGCGDPAHTARVEPAFRYFSVSGNDPRRWWAKFRGTAQAVIGGTPIMDVLGDWPLRDLVPAASQRRPPRAAVCLRRLRNRGTAERPVKDGSARRSDPAGALLERPKRARRQPAGQRRRSEGPDHDCRRPRLADRIMPTTPG